MLKNKSDVALKVAELLVPWDRDCPSVKLPIECQKIAKNLKNNNNFVNFFLNKWQVFGNFCYWNGNFPEGQLLTLLTTPFTAIFYDFEAPKLCGSNAKKVLTHRRQGIVLILVILRYLEQGF